MINNLIGGAVVLRRVELVLHGQGHAPPWSGARPVIPALHLHVGVLQSGVHMRDLSEVARVAAWAKATVVHFAPGQRHCVRRVREALGEQFVVGPGVLPHVAYCRSRRLCG